MKITVAGVGYVGLSLSVLLSQKFQVVAFDVDEKKLDMLNKKKSPIREDLLEKYLKYEDLNLSYTSSKETAFANSDFVIVCTPTNYDEETNYFDTSLVESVIRDSISINPHACIVIKSTIPVGFVDTMREKYGKNICFSPEFLREGRALEDNLYPSRIIIGSNSSESQKFVSVLKECAKTDDIITLHTGTKEAEAIKLFANSYLATRISFFNELDSYCLANDLNPKEIIDGVSSDERIGSQYNNPSFGYGGYCLPKDTKQLKANFEDTPQALISSVIYSNEKRISYIAKKIIEINRKPIGIYRLVMKLGSDNFRSSSTIMLLNKIIENTSDVVIYEPTLKDKCFEGFRLQNNLESFKEEAELIIANRLDSNLTDVKHKVFSRDIYNEN